MNGWMDACMHACNVMLCYAMLCYVMLWEGMDVYIYTPAKVDRVES